MKITEKQLKSLIKEEYLRITPVAPGSVMSEARAMYLAEEMLQEGLWDMIKASVKGVAAGAKSAAGDVGGIAADAVQSAVTPLINAGKAAAQAVSQIKDRAIQAAALEAAESLKTSIAGELKKSVAELVKKLVASGKSEVEAKAEAGKVIGPVLSQAIAGAMQQ